MERQIEGQRGLELRISNAQFSKLIKMGRDQGLTPQRVGQALFDEAYEAACLGNGRPAAAGGSASEAEAAHADFRKVAKLGEEWKARAEVAETERDELRARLAEAEKQRDFYKSEMTECREAQQREAGDMENVEARISELKAKLLRMTEKCEEQLDKREQEQTVTFKLQEDLRAAITERDQAHKIIDGKDFMLLDQARQIREAHAEIAQLRQRQVIEKADPVDIVATPTKPAPDGVAALYKRIMPDSMPVSIEPEPKPSPKPPRPAEPAIEQLGPIVPVRAIKGMNAAGNSPAEIARDLGLDVAIVRQVLG